MLLAGAGEGLAKLVNDGHPTEWAVFGAAILLGWVVMPYLIRRGRLSLACLLAAALFAAGCGVGAWRGRPDAAVVASGLLSLGWLVAAVFFGRRSSRLADSGGALDCDSDSKIK